MDASKKLRIAFLVNALIITVLLVAPIPFFTRIVKEVPLVSLILAEFSLVFLVVLASFPKAGIKDIARLAIQYLVFIGICFSLLSFLPIDSKFKLFHFGIQELEEGGVEVVPNLVHVNIIGVIILNTIAFLFFGTELNRKEPKRKFRNKDEREADNLEEIQIQKEELQFKNELKKDVDSLFNLYLNEFERGQIEVNEKLENIESALLDNIDMDISGAMCIDKQGRVLHDSIFHWDGYKKEEILETFVNNSSSSHELGTGALCQMMLKDKRHWYMVAKFRGAFLLLQAETADPSVLMSTSFRVIKAIRAMNK